MRIVIYGSSGSGKTITQNILVKNAVRTLGFRESYYFDGKGVEVMNKQICSQYITNDYPLWVETLESIVKTLEDDYCFMALQGIVNNVDPLRRDLIVFEDATVALKYAKEKSKIQALMSRLFETSRAAGTILIVNTQRLENTLPTAVRDNASVFIRMDGIGYFSMESKSVGNFNGKVVIDHISELPLTESNIYNILSPVNPPVTFREVDLYYGERGVGLTHKLEQTDTTGFSNVIYIDFTPEFKATSLKKAVEKAGYVVSKSDFIEVLRLAMQQNPTLLLLDNIDKSSSREAMLLIQSSTKSVITVPFPHGSWALEFFMISKFTRVKPLSFKLSRALFMSKFTHILSENYPRAIYNKYIESANSESQGMPKYITLLASRNRVDLLNDIEYIKSIPKPPNVRLVAVILVVALLGVLYSSDSQIVQNIAIFALVMLGRRIFMEWYRKLSKY